MSSELSFPPRDDTPATQGNTQPELLTQDHQETEDMSARQPTLDSIAIGAALENVMIAAGLNQAQLARRLGCDPAAVNRSIHGKRHVRAQEIQDWLDQCEVTGVVRLVILNLRLPCPTCGCRCDGGGVLMSGDASADSPGMELGGSTGPTPVAKIAGELAGDQHDQPAPRHARPCPA